MGGGLSLILMALVLYGRLDVDLVCMGRFLKDLRVSGVLEGLSVGVVGVVEGLSVGLGLGVVVGTRFGLGRVRG